jgi:hypothetical protein
MTRWLREKKAKAQKVSRHHLQQEIHMLRAERDRAYFEREEIQCLAISLMSDLNHLTTEANQLLLAALERADYVHQRD